MALSLDERARTRYHLGFPNIGSVTVLALGFPAGGHPLFLLESAMTGILPEGEPKFREVLHSCDCIERQLADARKRLPVATVGGINIRARLELEDLEEQYELWTDKLADIFGTPKNPFSQVHQRGGYIVMNPS